MKIDSKKKKILFIMPSMVVGGAERVLINLMNLLDKDSYDIELIAIERKGKLWDKIPQHVRKSQLISNYYICKIGVYLLRNYQIDWLFKYYAHKIKGNYDAAVCFLDSIYTEFLYYNKAEIHKRIAVVHSSYKTYGNKSKFIKGEYMQRMIKRYEMLDSIITVSHESLIQFKELFGEFKDTRVIYNPINRADVIKASTAQTITEMKEDTFNFVAVGSLLPVKGYDFLIEACGLLKKQNKNFCVYILGEGYLKDDLQRKIKDLELEEQIILKGFMSNPYVFMRQADMLIMTSVVEGLPTVLCEALILGTPAIVPNVPGCREVVDHGEFGCMYERQVEELAHHMAVMMNDKKQYQHYKEKAKARGKIFDDKAALEAYDKVFEG